MSYYRCDCIENKKRIEKEWNNYKNKGALLIDVRSKQEFQEGHIEGAISIPYYEISKRAENEISNKSKIIFLYCNTGRRSKKASIILKRLGYNNVKIICDEIEN